MKKSLTKRCKQGHRPSPISIFKSPITTPTQFSVECLPHLSHQYIPTELHKCVPHYYYTSNTIINKSNSSVAYTGYSHIQCATTRLCSNISLSSVVQFQRATFIHMIDVNESASIQNMTGNSAAVSPPIVSNNNNNNVICRDEGSDDDGGIDEIFGMMEVYESNNSDIPNSDTPQSTRITHTNRENIRNDEYSSRGARQSTVYNSSIDSTANSNNRSLLRDENSDAYTFSSERNNKNSNNNSNNNNNNMYRSGDTISGDSFSFQKTKDNQPASNSPSVASQPSAKSRKELNEEVDKMIRKAKIAAKQPIDSDISRESHWSEDDNNFESQSNRSKVEVIKEDEETANQPLLREETKHKRMQGVKDSDRKRSPPAPVKAWTCNVSVLDCFQRPVNHNDAAVEGTFSNFTELEKILPKSFAESFSSGRNKRGIKDEPTSLQKATIPVILQGRDVCMVGPTGSGKTLAYAIPVLAEVVRSLESDTNTGYALEKLVSQRISKGEMCRVCELEVKANPICPMTGIPHRRGPIEDLPAPFDDDETSEKMKRIRYLSELRSITEPTAIIFAPTGLLIYQLYRQFSNYAPMHVKVAHLFKPSSDKEANAMYRRFEGCDVLIASPEQTASAVTQSKLSLRNIKILVVDEMDTVLDTKHFEALKVALAEIQKDVRRRPQRVFVGASFPRDIRNALVNNLMHKNHRLILGNMNRSDLNSDVHTGSGNTNISHTILMLSRLEKVDKVKWLYDTGKCSPDQRTIIFCNSINTIKTLMEQLRPALAIHNVNPMMVHSKLSPEAQRLAMRAFYSGATTCLICSDICSTGIDFQKVMYVINYDMPEEFENWINRVGRTGRMGHRGYSYSFFVPENIRLAKPIYTYMRSLGQVVPAKLQDYARQGFVNAFARSNFYRNGKRMGPHLEEAHAPVFSSDSRYLQLKGSNADQRNTQLNRRPVS